MATVAAAAAAAAGTAAVLAYLDAKLHLRKDLEIIQGDRWFSKFFAQVVQQQRLSLWYFLEANAQQNGHGEALWWRARSFTWTEVYAESNHFAHFFLSRGVRPGDLVALYMRNSPDFVFAWFGLWAIGAAPALINVSLAGKALQHCVKISGAKLFLAAGDGDVLARVDEARTELETNGIVVLRLEEVKGEIDKSLESRPLDELRKGVRPDSPFGLFYTSGTTGMPKGCVVPVAAGIRGAVANKLGGYPWRDENERCFNCMPMYHGTGGITMMNQLLSGTTCCLAPKFSVTTFWSDVRDSGATWFIYVGETLRYLLAAPPSELDKDHNVHSVYGNGLRPDVWTRFQERFGIETMWEMFNSTEGMLALSNPCRNDFFAHSVGHHGFLQRLRYQKSLVAVEIDHETEDILKDPKTGFARRVPLDGRGEILIKIPWERPFPGYFNNPSATEKKYARDVFVKGDCYYRTGDALKMDDEGRWYFVDRLGDTFRWKGENVSTAEVSEVLGKFPGVVEAIVYGVQLPGHDGKAGAAALYIEPQNRASFNYTAFLKHARAQLPPYAVPIFLRLISAPAASHNNKHNKGPLKREGVHPDKVSSGDQLLWVDRLGKGDRFVEFRQEDWGSLGTGKAKL